MSHKQTGGSAFPTKNYQDVVPVATGYSEGMTLRDFFAAKAMQGYVAQGKAYDFADIAKASYRVADAMLKAREA